MRRSVCYLIFTIGVSWGVLGGPSTSAASPSPAPSPNPPLHYYDDALDGPMGGHIEYLGMWEHVTSNDDRIDGTSSRSFTTGARASFDFTGTKFAIIGITGPNGGLADVFVDQRRAGIANFFTHQKHTRIVVFESRTYERGSHHVEIYVASPFGSRRRYVNIDAIAFQ